jgi:phospholipid/cholesterol/gamma-HCH transport system permease protein
MSVAEYWNQMAGTTRISDLAIGLFTSFVYAVLISVCGCLRGIRCGRSSESVGLATTGAMVSSIISMVLATAIITVVTVRLGF